MKHHRPVVHVTPTGTIRQCQDCHQSWEMIREASGSYWRPIEERDQEGDLLKLRQHVLECQGETTTVTQERSKSGGFAAVDAKAQQKRKTVPCYCQDCQGRKPHHPDSTDCYCKSCKGRKSHYE